ncbi:MAG TPA: LuxR C-terminal-related transcriptional regulator [Bryobacteraceae bacterium]|jgi:DNA-binding NarL/FixJ family response regulator
MDRPHSAPEKREREELLLEQVREAQKAYYEAVAAYKEAIEYARKARPKVDADGQQSLYAAGRLENEALDNYHHALKTYVETLIAEPAAPATAQNGTADLLTQREQEVLKLVAEGLSSRKIAVQLGISFKTVTTHRYRIMEKLAIHEVAGLVRYALRKGLIQP